MKRAACVLLSIMLCCPSSLLLASAQTSQGFSWGISLGERFDIRMAHILAGDCLRPVVLPFSFFNLIRHANLQV